MEVRDLIKQLCVDYETTLKEIIEPLRYMNIFKEM